MGMKITTAPAWDCGRPFAAHRAIDQEGRPER